MTDHKAAAVAATQGRAEVHAMLALVEATERVAEQQRIANLIALWTVPEADAVALTKSHFPFGKVLTEIRESLGLS